MGTAHNPHLLLPHNLIMISVIFLSCICYVVWCLFCFVQTGRSVAQLLGLRRDATARMGLEKMKFLWETSLHFVLTLEGFSGSTAYVIRQVTGRLTDPLSVFVRLYSLSSQLSQRRPPLITTNIPPSPLPIRFTSAC